MLRRLSAWTGIGHLFAGNVVRLYAVVHIHLHHSSRSDGLAFLPRRIRYRRGLSPLTVREEDGSKQIEGDHLVKLQYEGVGGLASLVRSHRQRPGEEFS